jgi:GT2 family glycosyltransferase
MSVPLAGDPVVSVLMAVHGESPFLERAMTSILSQTLSDFEFIIVDDEASGNARALLAAYAARDSRIRLMRNEQNMGLAASMNRAMAVSRGRYIARMDSDDRSRFDRLKKQVRFLDAHPDISVCGGTVIKHVGDRKSVMRFPIGHDEICATLLFHTSFPHPAVMWRRADFERLGLRYDESFLITQDYELWSRAMRMLKGANLRDVILDYYCHEGQITSARYKRSLEYLHRVHVRLVRALLPDATPEQMDFHLRVAIPHDPFSRDELRRAEEWLCALRDANERARIYEPRALSRVLARQWSLICAISAARGITVLMEYTRSPLVDACALAKFGPKLAVRCILHRPG